MRKLKELDKKEIDEILDKRNIGVIEREITSFYNISQRQYYNLLRLNGIIRKYKVPKNKFNENYFESIDTEDKAYFLGFIVADGCVDKNTNNIKIIQKDPDILYEFKKYIEYEGDIFVSKTMNICNIGISSRKMKDDLYKLGIFSNKTMIIKYPNIPEKLQNHFMRGVFDGDGCISIHHDKRDGSDRGQVNICSGSIDFITEYVSKLVNFANLKGVNKIRCPRNTYHIIDWGGLSDVEKIYKFLYKDATVFLKRKKQTFDRVFIIHSNKKKYRKNELH